MPTTIAPMTPTDPALERVAAVFDDYRAHYGERPSPRLTLAWLRDQLIGHQLRVAAAVRADEVCGLITSVVLPASLRLGTVWSIRDLYVVPRHRRGGVANALLRHVIDEARAAGALRVSLQTEDGNLAALALYTGAGFRPVTGLRLLNLAVPPADPGPRAGAPSRAGAEEAARHRGVDAEGEVGGGVEDLPAE